MYQLTLYLMNAAASNTPSTATDTDHTEEETGGGKCDRENEVAMACGDETCAQGEISLFEVDGEWVP